MTDEITHRELAEILDREENHALEAMRGALSEVKREVRWLIILSVALNQFLSTVDLSQVAAAGVAGSLLLVWAAKVLGIISFGQ